MAWTADAILKALAAAPERQCMNYASLAEATGIAVRGLQNACQLLIKHGFITRTAAGCHKITAAGRAAVEAQAPIRPGKHAPNPLRQRAWELLRMLQKTSLQELCIAAAEGGERDIESALGKYVRALARAEYLVRLPVKGANGALRYRLARNTGPQAPVWDPINKVMRDPNNNEVHACG